MFIVFLICTTDDEVCRLRNMFCKIKYIVFKIKILTVLLLSRSFEKDLYGSLIYIGNLCVHTKIMIRPKRTYPSLLPQFS